MNLTHFILISYHLKRSLKIFLNIILIHTDLLIVLMMNYFLSIIWCWKQIRALFFHHILISFDEEILRPTSLTSYILGSIWSIFELFVTNFISFFGKLFKSFIKKEPSQPQSYFVLFQCCSDFILTFSNRAPCTVGWFYIYCWGNTVIYFMNISAIWSLKI